MQYNAFGGVLEWRALRVILAQRMGWTLEYVDSISTDDVFDIMAVLGAVKRASG